MILEPQIQPEIKWSNEANVNSAVLDSPGDREAKLRSMRVSFSFIFFSQEEKDGGKKMMKRI